MYETLTGLPSSQSSLAAFSHRHQQRCHSEPGTEGIPTPCRIQGRRCSFSGLVSEIHFFYVDHSNGSRTQYFVCYTMTMLRARDSYSKHCSKLDTEKRRGAKCLGTPTHRKEILHHLAHFFSPTVPRVFYCCC
jgi:hypothetical protein